MNFLFTFLYTSAAIPSNLAALMNGCLAECRLLSVEDPPWWAEGFFLKSYNHPISTSTVVRGLE